MADFRFDIHQNSKLCPKHGSHAESITRSCGSILSPEEPYRCDLTKDHELTQSPKYRVHHCCGADWEINWEVS